jgi:hypothetical protein
MARKIRPSRMNTRDDRSRNDPGSNSTANCSAAGCAAPADEVIVAELTCSRQTASRDSGRGRLNHRSPRPMPEATDFPRSDRNRPAADSLIISPIQKTADLRLSGPPAIVNNCARAWRRFAAIDARRPWARNEGFHQSLRASTMKILKCVARIGRDEEFPKISDRNLRNGSDSKTPGAGLVVSVQGFRDNRVSITTAQDCACVKAGFRLRPQSGIG